MESFQSACGCTNRERRIFLASGLALATMPWLNRVHAGILEPPTAESYVGDFYKSLNEGQRAELVLPFDHQHRTRVNANWHVTKPLIGSDFFSTSQRDLIEKIVRSACSEEGYERIQKQMADDDGGLGAYSVAVLGTPGTSAFEWMLTGRHLTLRIDGNSVPKTAFGGVMVYGHGEESSPRNNLFYDQTVLVNRFYQALHESQARNALLDKAPEETAVQLQGANGKFSGLAIGELNSELQTMFRETLSRLLSPYRAEDVQEAMAIIDATGGIQPMRIAFYRDEDLEKDGVWDLWRIEGPSCVIHFRGAPHVHAYIHIAQVG